MKRTVASCALAALLLAAPSAQAHASNATAASAQSDGEVAARLAALEARVKELEARRAVGIVDLKKLFDGLAEAAEWDVRIKTLEAKAVEESRVRKAELEAGVKELEAMPAGPEKEAKADELRLKKLQAEQWAAMKELEVDRERSLKLQSIYRNLREAAKQLVDSGKYAVIVIDDSKTELQTQRGQGAPSLEAQTLSQILQLRILGAARTVDVTDEIRVWLDNRHGSTQKSSGQAPAPATRGGASGTPAPAPAPR